jgi:pyruvate,water dikinase
LARAAAIKAPACTLGPEDFNMMKPGDALVAVTYSRLDPVCDGFGCCHRYRWALSHSSIVAREYGIPAVMAARGATRYIQSGQMVTVDGTAGTVVLE